MEEGRFIDIIRQNMDSFFLEKGLNYWYSEKNSIDGGFVAYSNRVGNIECYVKFLPKPDIVIIKKPSIIRSLFSLAKSERENYKSVSSFINEKVNTYEHFLIKSKSIIDDKKFL